MGALPPRIPREECNNSPPGIGGESLPKLKHSLKIEITISQNEDSKAWLEAINKFICKLEIPENTPPLIKAEILKNKNDNGKFYSGLNPQNKYGDRKTHTYRPPSLPQCGREGVQIFKIRSNLLCYNPNIRAITLKYYETYKFYII